VQKKAACWRVFLDSQIWVGYRKCVQREANKSDVADDGLLASLQAEIAQIRIDMRLQAERLMATIERLREENQILRRRLYGNRTERGNTSEAQLAFADLLLVEKDLQEQLDRARAMAKSIDKEHDDGAGGGDDSSKSKKKSPRGRRDLSQSTLMRVEVEIDDPSLEGKYPREGFDISYQLMKRPSVFAVLVKKTVKYKVDNAAGTSTLSAGQVPSLFERGLLHPSAVAAIVVDKFSKGVPLYRQEQHILEADASIDRGMMSRYVDEAGNAFGATVVNAMWKDAVANAGVISTDATGALIQPEPSEQDKAARNAKRKRLFKRATKRACKKGHFFTAVVDESAVLFRYVPSHTQAVVAEIFGEFRGYLQADAHHVYNVLERPPPRNAGDQDNDKVDESSTKNARIKLVGCWAHARRYFFEAALCRHSVGVQGLQRIAAIYVIDRAVMKLPREKRTSLRQEKVRPLMDELFSWAEKAQADGPRSLAEKALGYITRQKSELLTVLENPDVPLDNTRAERHLRKIVVGRKNWLFYGSDTHAEGAAAIFSLLATCRLHRVEPHPYFEELMRVLPFWPAHRYLELAPQNWTNTRARLVAAELDKPIARITVPPELEATTA
jgi:transposase